MPPPPSPMDALTAQVATLAAHVTAMQASLDGHKTRLESAITTVNAKTANASDVPALIAATTVIATDLQQTIDSLKTWSDNEVSQTYLNGLLP